jgi:hypothetical protein
MRRIENERDAVVTIGEPQASKPGQSVLMAGGRNSRTSIDDWRTLLHSVKACNLPPDPFHGDNTGSNPVGDANKINNLDLYPVFSGPPRDHCLKQ